MRLTTDAIENGYFDPRYTCDVDNSSPDLRWEDAPQDAAGFVLLAEDPDAPNGLFSHWVVYNIPGALNHLPAGIPPQDTLPNGIRQGVNGFNKLGYSGPCPPSESQAHRYIFRLYALRVMPELPARARREQVLSVIDPLVITTAEVEGRYQRVLEQRAG